MKIKDLFKKKDKKEEVIKILTEEPKKPPISTNTPTSIHQTELPKEPVGIRQQLEEVNEKLDMIVPKAKEQKLKPFKMSWGMNSKLKKLGKTDSVLVILLKTNRAIEPTTAKIKNGFIVINDKYHNCSTDFVYLWQGKSPAIVLPEWDLNPIGTKDYYDAVKEGRKADSEEVFIRGLENINLEEKKKISGKTWIWILIGAVIVGYVLFSGQKK